MYRSVPECMMPDTPHHAGPPPGPVSAFLERHFRHFNAATLVAAARGYADHLESGGGMMVTLAGAMSTAELGLSLAEMIRQDKVDAICCTGANLEEDIFNLVAHDSYVRVPHYRDLTPADEAGLLAGCDPALGVLLDALLGKAAQPHRAALQAGHGSRGAGDPALRQRQADT